MSKYAPTATLDPMLDKVATAVQQIACSAQPLTYADATATYKLGSVAVGSGDFSKGADAATTGRKLTVAQKTGGTISTSGTATHVALVDGTTLLYVTTCPSQALTAGNPLTFNSWGITNPQPT